MITGKADSAGKPPTQGDGAGAEADEHHQAHIAISDDGRAENHAAQGEAAASDDEAEAENRFHSGLHLRLDSRFTFPAITRFPFWEQAL